MQIAEIIKKKKADSWLVVQGLPVDGGGSTCGEIIFQGQASIEIARLIPKCYQSYMSHKPVTEGRLHPAFAAFGYRSGSSLQRYAHTMSIWVDEFDVVYGNIQLGSKEGCPFVLRVELALPIPGIDMASMAEEIWQVLQTSFAYAEQFKG